MPTQPSVYCFEDEAGKPLYIGKSIHPKSRIRQHLQQAGEARSKQREFINLAKWIRFYQVESEIESLLLESKLIRLHQPFYNSMSKDDKSSTYIMVGSEDFPVVSLIRGAEIESFKSVFGPFRTRYEAEMVLKVARNIFMFCQNPPNNGVKRACFYHHIGRCDGACIGLVSKSKYRSKIGYLKRFLNGSSVGLLISLEKKIRKLAKAQKYEEADEVKKMYEAVKWATNTRHGLADFLKDDQTPERAIRELKVMLSSYGMESSLERIEGYDVATTQQKDTVGAMVVFFLGTADKSSYRKFKLDRSNSDTNAMKQMLKRRIRRTDWPRPDLILVDGGRPQLSTALKLIKDTPVIGLAKKEELIVIFYEDKFIEVEMPRRSKALQLLQQIRDEAHRFGTGYHKQVRDKRSLSYKLTWTVKTEKMKT